MAKKKTENENPENPIKRHIETGDKINPEAYQPTDELDTSNPPRKERNDETKSED